MAWNVTGFQQDVLEHGPIASKAVWLHVQAILKVVSPRHPHKHKSSICSRKDFWRRPNHYTTGQITVTAQLQLPKQLWKRSINMPNPNVICLYALQLRWPHSCVLFPPWMMPRVYSSAVCCCSCSCHKHLYFKCRLWWCASFESWKPILVRIRAATGAGGCG